MAAFALSGRLLRHRPRRRATPRLLETRRRRSSTRGRTRAGPRVAYVAGRALRVHDVATGVDHRAGRARADTGHLRTGRVRRRRGDGPDARLLVVAGRATRCWSRGSTTRRCRAGTSPTRPTRTGRPTVVAYPAAGTPNAGSTLVVVGARRQPRVECAWDAVRDEYLVTAVWDADELLVVVQTRDQRALRVLRVDPATGATAPRARGHRPGLGRHRARRAGAHRAAARWSWTADDGRRAPAARRRRAGHARRRCRCARCSTWTATRVLFSA